MNFTIRDLLALTLLVALVALIAYSYAAAQRQRLKIAQVQAQIAAQREEVAVMDRMRYYAEAEKDWLNQINVTSLNGLNDFPRLQEKYGQVTSRGADFLSLRKVPMIAEEGGSVSRDRYRIYVPEAKVYLKFAVILDFDDSPVVRARSHPAKSSESPFTLSGPFEIQMPPGINDVDLIHELTPQRVREFKLYLNETLLLHSIFSEENTTSYSSTSLAGHRQIDYRYESVFPELWGFKLYSSDTTRVENRKPGFRIWLDQTSSQFATFPGDSPANINVAHGAEP
jgi:hypothetical protein